MAAAGIRSLLCGRATVEELLLSWPDSRCHMARLGEGHVYVQELFDALGYDGPPEVFTMWCCLFNDPAIQRAVRG